MDDDNGAETARQTPVLLRRTLVAQGWTDTMLSSAVRSGELARARRGAYVDGPTWRALGELGRHQLTARAVVAQAERSRGNLVALLDFARPLLGVFAEVDGKAKYLERRRKGETIEQAVLREKDRENLVRRLTGWRGLRVEWADLGRPEATGRMVARELFPVDLSA